uniref:Ig-like domain-containing protein n=1 Tax=Varanus komodoensis TaxID=61221 RepID=A0A8D2L850_VARKO
MSLLWALLTPLLIVFRGRYRPFCSFRLSGSISKVCSTRGQDGLQPNPFLKSKAGEDAAIRCEYETKTLYSLQWYRQRPGESPVFLLLLMSGRTADRKEPNLSAELNTKNRSSHLHIRGAQLTDSATYFCAIEAQLHRSLVFQSCSATTKKALL